MEIGEEEIAPITALLASAPFISPVCDRVWAPRASRSALFKSDWISIGETGGGRFALKARKRGLNFAGGNGKMAAEDFAAAVIVTRAEQFD